MMNIMGNKYQTLIQNHKAKDALKSMVDYGGKSKILLYQYIIVIIPNIYNV